MRRILKWVVIDLIVIVAVALAVLGVQYFGGQPMGFFSGSTPSKLGFNDGKFVVPSNKPNWVSSTVDKTDAHYIEPIAIENMVSKTEIQAEARGLEALAKLGAIAKGTLGATQKSASSGYLYLEFKTPGLGFVDDVELALDTKAMVVHVKSGSRLGYRDFNLNRKRIETLRMQFSKPV